MAKKSSSTKRSSTKRDLVKSRGGKSFAKRTTKGRFKEMDSVKRSLSSDRRKKANGRSSPVTATRATGGLPQRQSGESVR